MSDADHSHEAAERLDYDDAKAGRSGFDRRTFLRNTALTGAAAGSVGALLSACGSSASSSSGASSIFGTNESFKFTFVNHVTTNPFFVPTQYGIQDACKLLGCTYSWTGSETSNVSQMVNAVNSAIAAKVDGIAVSLVDLTAFNAPVKNALGAGIPVVSYNADVEPPANQRLAYIGQNLEVSGEVMGLHIAELVPSGDVALFIATPGSLNIQPRINGALKTLKKHSSITTHVIATGAAVPQELTVIESYLAGHPETKGMFAVDAGSTEGVAKTIQKKGAKGKVKGGGYDLLENTEKLLSEGYIQFTIDQQPYLQGFLPVLELYLYQVSKTLTGPADVNTGLKFLNEETVKPYVSTKSRFEGTSSTPGVQNA
ncbi:MAG TPA: sugar ABC transporter substrate-binding protein [Solirubrobacteraceae bacterium]|nr:sugar ABC transporter substrate-binding protein [Solirubrobacteraceae bacterium]